MGRGIKPRKEVGALDLDAYGVSQCVESNETIQPPDAGSNEWAKRELVVVRAVTDIHRVTGAKTIRRVDEQQRPPAGLLVSPGTSVVDCSFTSTLPNVSSTPRFRLAFSVRSIAGSHHSCAAAAQSAFQPSILRLGSVNWRLLVFLVHDHRSNNMARYRPRSRAPRARCLADIRRLRDPRAQAQALLSGPNLYINDDEGWVYLHARIRTSIWKDFQDNRISWPTLRANLDIKAGHTKDLERRLGEYDICTPEYMFFWTCAYRTAQRMLLERLVHLALRQLGAKLKRYRCHGCGKRHREYYDFVRAGGFIGVERVIRYCLWKMGETVPVRCEFLRHRCGQNV
ncbi:hypothetical protein C8F04DRAFT_1264558 [Mycena alexandri]|uniref:Bacteriophage T5 Orf172 DNA-binding domain-containing protein n=1 Tax=Mycena alexandri TaxID=1745969 RepID=A0AAD6SLG6_9AGAR|nr:hypothetical protein C8F04DRAFT_1264558 [Mycena alexandri]